MVSLRNSSQPKDGPVRRDPKLRKESCGSHVGADPGILERGGGGLGSSQRQVRRNVQIDKPKKLLRGEGVKPPDPPESAAVLPSSYRSGSDDSGSAITTGLDATININVSSS